MMELTMPPSRSALSHRVETELPLAHACMLVDGHLIN